MEEQTGERVWESEAQERRRVLPWPTQRRPSTWRSSELTVEKSHDSPVTHIRLQIHSHTSNASFM